jgi:hypothetical protein
MCPNPNHKWHHGCQCDYIDGDKPPVKTFDAINQYKEEGVTAMRETLQKSRHFVRLLTVDDGPRYAESCRAAGVTYRDLCKFYNVDLDEDRRRLHGHKGILYII